MLYSDPVISRADIIRCALCLNAPCTQACGKTDPARLLRAVWFRDEQTAALSLPPENPCLTCAAPCERACVRPN